MNRIIEEQLKKVKSVSLVYDKNSSSIFIPKSSEISADILVRGSICIIELTNFADNREFAITYNNGRVPSTKLNKVELLEVDGDMFQFAGIPIVDGEEKYSIGFFFWLRKDMFKVVEKFT